MLLCKEDIVLKLLADAVNNTVIDYWAANCGHALLQGLHLLYN